MHRGVGVLNRTCEVSWSAGRARGPFCEGLIKGSVGSLTRPARAEPPPPLLGSEAFALRGDRSIRETSRVGTAQAWSLGHAACVKRQCSSTAQTN